MIHEELSGEIIGAAMEVLNALKPGLDEKLYERALIIELMHCAHIITAQRSFPVSYRGELIGNLIPCSGSVWFFSLEITQDCCFDDSAVYRENSNEFPALISQRAHRVRNFVDFPGFVFRREPLN